MVDWPIKVISGGQTGVDRAALNVALELGLPCGGFVPRGRLAEDGVIDKRYPVMESATSEYAERTELNVNSSKATLIISSLPLSGGTKLTQEFCEKYQKPYLVCDLNVDLVEQVKKVKDWLLGIKPAVLNIAGPRESEYPSIYQKTYGLLHKIFT